MVYNAFMGLHRIRKSLHVRPMTSHPVTVFQVSFEHLSLLVTWRVAWPLTKRVCDWLVVRVECCLAIDQKSLWLVGWLCVRQVLHDHGPKRFLIGCELSVLWRSTNGFSSFSLRGQRTRVPVRTCWVLVRLRFVYVHLCQHGVAHLLDQNARGSYGEEGEWVRERKLSFNNHLAKSTYEQLSV